MASKQNDEKKYFDLGKFDVRNVRSVKGGIVIFTLVTKGIMLYDMRYVPAGKNKAGKRYKAFIACPEEKGKDGNYYKRYNIYLSDEDTDAIVAVVEDLIENL